MPSCGDLLESLRATAPTSGIELQNEPAVAAVLTAAQERGDSVASSLLLIIDYDLTISASATAECHHMLRDSVSVPESFRADVRTLFDARDPQHAQHRAIYGSEADEDRPHRFWMHYNKLLVQHRVTHGMIESAVAEEGRRRGGRLLREGVCELLTLCDAAGVLVVILSAGLEQVITAAFAHDGVALPADCRLLTNRCVFGDGGCCVAVEPSHPPASREGKLLLLGSLTEAAERSLVLLVGDKPVDARVAKGLVHGTAPRVELSFGFFNDAAIADSAVPALKSDWEAAFHLLATRGSSCSFAPVTELVRQLLTPEDDASSTPRTHASLASGAATTTTTTM
jgi:hypothetical protein